MQRDSHVPSIDEEDFHLFVRRIFIPQNERALRWNLILKGRMTQKIVRIRKIWRMMMMKGKTMKMIVGRGTSRRRT